MKRYSYVIVFALSFVISLLLYANSLKGDFIYDDYYFVPRAELRDIKYLPKVFFEPYQPYNRFTGNYRPLSVFTFGLNFILFGESTVSFHVVNVILNAINVFLFFVLIDKLFKDKILATFSSLIYAFMPIHTEAVSYIKARDDIMGSIFTFASWVIFIKGTRDTKINIIYIFLSSLVFLLALLSKDLVVLNPAIFILVYWILEKPKFRNVIKTVLGFVPAAAIYLVARYVSLGQHIGGFYQIFYQANPLKYVDLWPRIWSAFKILYVYLRNILAPFWLSATYHINHFKPIFNPLSSPDSILGIIFLFLLLALVLYKKTKRTPLGIGSLMFLVSYLVISQFIFAAGDIMGDKWVYFPSAGIGLIVGYLFSRLYRHRKGVSLVLISGLLLFYASLLFNRNKIFASEEAFYTSMTIDAPKSVQGHYGLSLYYLKNNNLKESKKHAEMGYKIDQSYPPLLNVLGGIAFREGRAGDAIKIYQESLKIDPTYVRTYGELGAVYFAQKEYEKAKVVFEFAIKRWEDQGVVPKIEFIVSYSAVLAKLNRYQESLDFLNKYLTRENLTNSGVRLLFAVNYYHLGRKNEAAGFFDWTSDLSEQEKLKIIEDY